MSISAVGSAPVTPISSENTQAPGPEQDSDSDNTGAQASAQAAPPVQSTPARGTGTIYDKSA
jgi:hypothetical protein